MSSLTRTMLPVFALAAMMSVAQAQTAKPGAPSNAPMIGQGMGGVIVQPGTQPQTGQPGMMMGMDQMRSMMGQQDGQSGMMGNMGAMLRQTMGQQGGMGLPFEHVEGRIAFLKAELKITDAQAPQWNAFTDTLRVNAKAHQAVHEQMTKGGVPTSWPDRLAAQQKMLGMRLDVVKALEAATKPLYAVLTDEQKKLADQLLSSPMGMM